MLPERNAAIRNPEESPLFRNLQVILPGFVGTVFLIGGLVISWSQVDFLRHSRSATARVTGVEAKQESTDSGYRTRHYPRLEFRDAAGATHEFTGEVSSNRGKGSGWRIGSTASVRYNTANPDEARMAGVYTLLPFIFPALGLCAIVLAFKMRAWTKEMARRELKRTRGNG